MLINLLGPSVACDYDLRSIPGSGRLHTRLPTVGTKIDFVTPFVVIY
jgi:hypothetical protein